MPQWTGRITVTIDVDDYFEANSEREAEEYVESNWTEYLYRASTESIEVDMEEEDEDEEESTNIPGIEE